jgi:O-antigen ligase
MFGYAGDLSEMSLIVGVALLIGWALNGFGDWHLGKSRGVVRLLLFYTAWYGISTALSTDQSLAFSFWLELLKIALPFLVGATMMKSDKEWRPLLWVIVVSQALVGLQMNLDYLRGYNTAADGYGWMDNNCYGVSLVTTLGPAIALVVTTNKWWERSLAAASAAVILHTTMLTFSRGAMIGLLAVGATAFLALPKRPAYIAVILGIALLAVQLTGPQLMARYSTVFASEGERDASSQSRLDLWKDCLTVIASAPVFGIGPANWRAVAPQFGWTEGKSAHSVWMETAAEVGIPGVLALFSFFALAAFKLWPLARERLTDSNRYRVASAMSVVLGVVGFGSAGQFVSLAGLEVPYYIVMIGAAVLANPIPVEERSVEEAPRSVAGAAAGASLSSRPAPRRSGTLLPDLRLRSDSTSDRAGSAPLKILPRL